MPKKRVIAGDNNPTWQVTEPVRCFLLLLILSLLLSCAGSPARVAMQTVEEVHADIMGKSRTLDGLCLLSVRAMENTVGGQEYVNKIKAAVEMELVLRGYENSHCDEFIAVQLAEAEREAQLAVERQVWIDSIFNPAQDLRVLLFGGRNNDVFLGCLTCDDYASDSATNPYGDFGSTSSSTSIFNNYSDYGSAFSQYSACNRYASNPPVVVDSNGGFHGYMTLNTSKQFVMIDGADELKVRLENEICN